MKPVRVSLRRAGFHLPFRQAVGQRGMTRLLRLFMAGILLFFAAQRTFVEGVTLTGVKG